MGAIQEWTSGIKPETRQNPSQDLVNELFTRIKKNLWSTNPDYSDSIMALASFSPAVFEEFYNTTYAEMDENIQSQWNQALLSWADESKEKTAFRRMIEAIKVRLSIVKGVDELSHEIQWCVARFNVPPKPGHYKVKCLKAMQEGTTKEHLHKLLSLNVTGWSVNRDFLLNFYFILFPIFYSKQEEDEFLDFLDRNHLNKPDASIISEGNMSQSAVEAHVENDSDTLEQKARSHSSEVESQQNDESKMIGQDSDVGHKDKVTPATQTTEALDTQKQPMPKTDITQPTVVVSLNVEPQTTLSTVPKQENPEPLENNRRARKSEAKEQDGLKMLRRALAWAEQQTQDIEELKETLTKSESRVRLLEAEKSALEHRLQDAMSEASALRIQLSNAENQVNEEREKYQNLDSTVEALHHMNENTELQAINGFKADLASAVQSIVRDARLPEAQGNAEILSALLEDLLDTMRFKGIPMEEE